MLCITHYFKNSKIDFFVPQNTVEMCHCVLLLRIQLKGTLERYGSQRNLIMWSSGIVNYDLLIYQILMYLLFVLSPLCGLKQQNALFFKCTVMGFDKLKTPCKTPS